MSYTTRLTERTVLQIFADTCLRKAASKEYQSAVIPSAEVTARRATTWLCVLWSPCTPTDLNPPLAQWPPTFLHPPHAVINSTHPAPTAGTLTQELQRKTHNRTLPTHAGARTEIAKTHEHSPILWNYHILKCNPTSTRHTRCTHDGRRVYLSNTSMYENYEGGGLRDGEAAPDGEENSESLPDLVIKTPVPDAVYENFIDLP